MNRSKEMPPLALRPATAATALCRLVLLFFLLLVTFPGQILKGASKEAGAVSASPSGKSSSPHTVLPPEFSAPSGVYTNSFVVQLSPRSAGGLVRYTLDGSDPKESSAVFSNGLRISTTTLIKARTFLPGAAPSATICHTYVMLEESLFGFNSNLPLVILHTFEGYVSHETPIPISARFIYNRAGRTFLTGPGDFDGRGTLKTRGRSSMEYPKRSFAFHTRDDTDLPVKAPLLGLPKESDWVLYAPYPDKTLMRDALAYELSNQMGHYAPRTRFVELFVSRVGGKLSTRSYHGVYVLVEKIKRSKSRVDIQKLGPQDNAEPDISGGYIFKKDHGDKDQPRFATSRGSHFYYVEPKAEEMTPAQRSWLTGYLNRAEGALYGPNFKDPQRGYAAFFDTDSLIDQHWIVEMSKNVDGIRFSNFLHKDRGGKIKMDPIWDWNLSFGNASGKQGWSPEGWYGTQLDDYEYLWFGRLFEDPDFTQKSVDRWAALRTNVFATSRILARVDEIASLLREAQARNFRRWPVLGRYVHPNWYVGKTYEEEVEWMKQWITNRLTWIDRQFLAVPTLKKKQEGSGAACSVTMAASAGKIYYTMDNSDPRAPGGAISPQAHVFSEAVALKENGRILARAYRGNSWSGLAEISAGQR